MARHRQSQSAEYISLASRATSPSGLSYSHAAVTNPSQEAPLNVLAPSSSRSKKLDHRKQIWSLLLPQTARWIGTVALSALLISVIRIYERKGNFTRKDKDTFNIIVTGLSVGLGINFFVRPPFRCSDPLDSLLTIFHRKRLKNLQKACDGEFWPTKDIAFGRWT